MVTKLKITKQDLIDTRKKKAALQTIKDESGIVQCYFKGH